MQASLSPKVLSSKINGNDALSPALVAEFKRICDSVEADAHHSFLLLHVQGDAEPLRAQRWPGEEHLIDPHLMSQWEQVLRRLELLRTTTMTVVEGMCGGLALEILLATDYRLMCTGSKIHMNGPLGAVWPGMAIHRLTNQIGVARSRRIALFGGELSETFACETGLVDEAVDDFETSVNKFVESCGEISAAEVAVRRTLLLEATSTSFESALGVHLAGCDRQLRNVRKLNNRT
jgi:isomerase DpgB